MATVGVVEAKHAEGAPEENCSAKPTKQGEGLRHYYSLHIHENQLLLRQKTHNLNRLEAQRNELNSRGPLTLTLILFSFSFFNSFLLIDLLFAFLFFSATIIQFNCNVFVYAFNSPMILLCQFGQ